VDGFFNRFEGSDRESVGLRFGVDCGVMVSRTVSHPLLLVPRPRAAEVRPRRAQGRRGLVLEDDPRR